jgi:hypothetical protein
MTTTTQLKKISRQSERAISKTSGAVLDEEKKTTIAGDSEKGGD